MGDIYGVGSPSSGMEGTNGFWGGPDFGGQSNHTFTGYWNNSVGTCTVGPTQYQDACIEAGVEAFGAGGATIIFRDFRPLSGWYYYDTIPNIE